MKIYTKSGDVGTTTTLRNPKRVPKNHPLIQALGNLDELNSHLGMAIALLSPKAQALGGPKHPKSPNLPKTKSPTSHLQDIQRHLFHIGTLLQSSSPNTPNSPNISSATKQLEKSIDQLSKNLHPLKNFILPGGHPAAAQLHLTRTVCRRTERTVTQLKPPQEIARYLNRLSDYLFTLARWVNHRVHTPETLLT